MEANFRRLDPFPTMQSHIQLEAMSRHSVAFRGKREAHLSIHNRKFATWNNYTSVRNHFTIELGNIKIYSKMFTQTTRWSGAIQQSTKRMSYLIIHYLFLDGI